MVDNVTPVYLRQSSIVRNVMTLNYSICPKHNDIKLFDLCYGGAHDTRKLNVKDSDHVGCHSFIIISFDEIKVQNCTRCFMLVIITINCYK